MILLDFHKVYLNIFKTYYPPEKLEKELVTNIMKKLNMIYIISGTQSKTVANLICVLKVILISISYDGFQRRTGEVTLHERNLSSASPEIHQRKSIAKLKVFGKNYINTNRSGLT